MQLLFASGLLDLGSAPSSFGVTLSLILIFVVIIGGLAQALIGFTFSQVMAERRANIKRRAEYDERHSSK